VAPASGVVARPGEPVFLQYAVLAYLVVLPVAHLLTVPMGGVWMTAADPLLGILILVGVVEWVRARRADGNDHPADPGQVASVRPALFLLVFAAWVAASALWGFHAKYALLKGLGTVALALGVIVIGESKLPWRRAIDAWLLGTGLAVLVTWVFALVGPEALSARVLYTGGMVDGLPFLRVRGPFVHPNLFGDYLVVSGVLLWARWGDWRRARPMWSGVLAVGLAGTFIATVSSAAVQAGIAMMFLGLTTMRRRGGMGSSLRRPLPILLLVAGLLTTVVTTASLVIPSDFSVGPLQVETGGIRPVIWESAFEAVKEAPLLGVGAAPYVALAADPRAPGSDPGLWDAHNAYLSVWAQYGLVGLLLGALPLFLIVRNLLREGTSNVRIALLVALLSAAVHAVFAASEEFRHLWALLGIAVLATHWGAMRVGGPLVPQIGDRTSAGVVGS
jgi:O-antigen ligase/polysaccharide polymerase Wzy-like membrane protein